MARHIRRLTFSVRLLQNGHAPRGERRRYARLRRRPLGHGQPVQASGQPGLSAAHDCPRRLQPERYDAIQPTKIALNLAVTTPAECATLVRRDFVNATAAEYSNVGGEWCTAVFDACARTPAQIANRFAQLSMLLRV